MYICTVCLYSLLLNDKFGNAADVLGYIQRAFYSLSGLQNSGFAAKKLCDVSII